MLHRKTRLAGVLLLALLLATPALHSQGKVTSPKEQFGFNIGDDYQLFNYTQLTAYWNKLAQESPRIKVVEIGKTAEGRPMIMGIITSPENHKRLDRFKEISARLARAEGLTDDQARALAAEGKAVVWIDGGLHATEILGSQQLGEIVYQMVSGTDAETLRILNDVILLAVPVNPDGLELVANWYMRESDPTRRTMGGLPVLYHKYAGHDDNRDSYMINLPETEADSRVMYQEWYPQIMYNHHQSGPAGTVLFAPPFRDPFNYNFDPLVPMELDLVSAAMHTRFVQENKPGATMRSGSSYSTWWNGGLRTTVYFHNMIGILTEAIGNPTPVQIPFIPDRQLPKQDYPFPVAPTQTWHFRQSIDYSITADKAILDVASRHREQFLYNFYQMGRNQIRKGSQDTWTMHPKAIDAVQAAVTQDTQGATPAAGRGGAGGRGGAQGAAAAPQAAAGRGAAATGGRGGRGGVDMKYWALLHRPEDRDPRGYILPSDQPDFATATKFVNTLTKAGVTWYRATAPFTVAGKNYPADSYVVKTAQAFRAHVIDMFEPQDHPNDFAYPGGPPRPPYDSAGWTLAFQMGIKFDRILDAFDGPFEKNNGFAKVPAGKVVQAKANTGYLLTHQMNDSFVALNQLLKGGKEEVFFLNAPLTANGKTYPAGTIYIPSKPTTAAALQKLTDLGLTFEGVATKPGEMLKLRPVRVGLYDRYGGSMPSGWVRWLLEQFQFPFEQVFPPALDAGNLAAKYDVLIFLDGIPATATERQVFGGGEGGPGGVPANVPPEYRNRVGNITVGTTIPQIKKFVEDGGTIIAVGSSAMNLGRLFNLPMADHMIERSPTAPDRRLPQDKFYCPGSILQAAVDPTIPVAWGFGDKVDVFFNNSPVFDLTPDAAAKGVRAVAWYDSATPLRSGWAWGQNYLEDGVAAIDAAVGKGHLYLFGPEITFRAQPHGTFKFLFNGIYLSVAKPGRPGQGKATSE